MWYRLSGPQPVIQINKSLIHVLPISPVPSENPDPSLTLSLLRAGITLIHCHTQYICMDSFLLDCSDLFDLIIGVFCLHICVFTCIQCLQRSKEGVGSSGWLWGNVWVLGIKPSPSTRAASALNARTIPPALLLHFSLGHDRTGFWHHRS